LKLSKFELEFIKFCRHICPMGCDTMKLKRKENRYEAILESCPIIKFDKYLAEKNGVEIDFIEATKFITNHNMWRKMQ
jgi:hypothetical protein